MGGAMSMCAALGTSGGTSDPGSSSWLDLHDQPRDGLTRMIQARSLASTYVVGCSPCHPVDRVFFWITGPEQWRPVNGVPRAQGFAVVT